MLGTAAPRVLPPASSAPSRTPRLDDAVVRVAFRQDRGGRGQIPPEVVAEGFLTIAIENMANAIKKIQRPAAAMT